MSSLHQDHLHAEGSEPTKGTGSTLTTARRTSRKPVTEKASNNVPTPRKGKAQTEGSASTTTGGSVPASGSRRAAGVKAAAAAGTLAVRAKAAGSATTKAASAKAATARAATAKAVSARAAGAAKAAAVATSAARTAAAAKVASRAAKAPAATPGKPATAKPAPAKPAPAKPAPAKPAPAKPAAAKPAKPATAKVEAAKPAAAEPAAAKPAAAKPAAAKKAAAKPAAATKAAAPAVRPTPYKRPVAEAEPAPAPVVEVPEAAEAAEVVASVAESRRSWFGRRPPQVRRRPALYLAAALVGALSVSGFASGDPAAQATSTVSHSVSVAQELGIEAAPSEEITALDATRQLGELAASRDVRDAEQAAAAQAQANADKAAAAAAAAAAAEAARPKAVLPVQGARLTSGFGARWGTLHAGIDLAAPMHTPEYAAMDGVVLEAGPASGFGLAVYIQHANGDVTVYGHMDSILVEAGQVVKAGETIALLGNRGQSTGPHLHFEVHIGGIDGQKVDPIPYLRERGVRI
jgi:murein DD-endopeptidase MepM/ murein hydrolase activator NlpD